MESQTGTRPIGGRYRTLNLLGAGGMGRVYRAIDLTTSQVITLKTVKTPMDRLEIARRTARGGLRPPTGMAQDTQLTPGSALADAGGGLDETMPPGSAAQGIGSMPTETVPRVTAQLPGADLPAGSPPAAGIGDTEPSFDEEVSTGGGATEPSLDAPFSPDGLPSQTDEDTEPSIEDSEASQADEPDSGLASFRLALAHEFEMLSSIRHPNIISVLDYGFDEVGQPYFTMPLVENALPFDKAGRDKGLSVQVDMLVQLLQALDYLHWRNIIHRDLKPGNVLVVDGEVRVLDFGLSMRAENLDDTADEVGGTVAFIAPEVFQGTPPSPSSDLFAVGVMAYQLFTGRLPIDEGNRYQMVHQTMTRDPEIDSLDLPDGIKDVLRKLLAKTPQQRYATAREVIGDLAAATQQAPVFETVRTRESFLEWAPLVGRDDELTVLTRLLDDALDGHGGAMLLGGESGVGKTRLLNEVRIQAQVRGALLLRGQAVGEGGDPYQEWRDIARTLCTLDGLTDFELGVLSTLVHDIEYVIDRPVTPPKQLDPTAAKLRLFAVIKDILVRQPRPVVLLLEDLHWASAASVALTADLAGAAAEAKMCLVGSYREDERPQLPDEVPTASAMRLERLPADAVDQFARRVLGNPELPAELLERLRTETEGNPFFLVEVLRSLAEDAGQLDRIESMELPETVFTGGMQRIVEIRLGRLTGEDRSIAEAAAVVGRAIDLALLRELFPDADLGDWLDLGHAVALLETRDGRMQFAHDKLREGLLQHLADEQRARAHGQVARAIETVHADERRYHPALAYHWGRNGDTDKECRYSILAAERALRSGVCSDAIELFSRADEILPDGGVELPADPVVDVPEAGEVHTWTSADLKAQLAEAHFQLGKLEGVREHGTTALQRYGQGMPGSGLGWILGLWWQIGMRFAQAALPSLFAVKDGHQRHERHEAMRVQERMTELFIYDQNPMQIMWSGLKVLNLGNPIEATRELARGYGLMAILMGSVPIHKLARKWADHALALADGTGDPIVRVSVMIRRAVYWIGLGDWEILEREMTEGYETSRELKDGRHADECTVTLSKCHHYQGDFERGAELAERMYGTGKERGDTQVEGWGLLAMIENRVRQGRQADVQPYFEPMERWIETAAASTEKICPVGMMALAHYYDGRTGEAKRLADQAVELAKTTNTLVYWTLSGMCGAAEVHLRSWETDQGGGEAEWAPGARQLLKSIKGYAKVFPMGTAAHLLMDGWLAWVEGKQDRAVAQWEACIEEATQRGTRYELAQAHLHLAMRRPDHPDSAEHGREALRLLEEQGGAFDLDDARSAFGAPDGERAADTLR